MSVLQHLEEAVMMTAGMVWQTIWSLVLGFSISALLQATVSSDDLREAFGKDGPKEIALAAAAGAASSSCSYASASIMRTLFKKGAALATAMAFMIASTNLVLELGLILLVLLGWKFMLGQWIGGVVLVAVMSLVVRATAPKGLIEAARSHEEAGGGHDHGAMVAEGATWWARVTNPKTRILVAQSFAMEWRMLWKDLAIGFVVGGLISAFVPAEVWKALFLGGASFAGVLSFIYADLIVLPLVDTYRRYFGWRMAAYMFAVLFVTMAIAGIVVDLLFAGLGLTPATDPNVKAQIMHFSLNYTFWLNLAFGAVAAYLFWVASQNPMDHAMSCCGASGGHHHAHSHQGHESHATH